MSVVTDLLEDEIRTAHGRVLFFEKTAAEERAAAIEFDSKAKKARAELAELEEALAREAKRAAEEPSF